MSAENKPPFLVQAVYSFKGQNNDELCFKKHDIITVTQVEDGGWWEGTLKDKTGWFPSNYVREYKSADAGSNNSVNILTKSNIDLIAQQSANRTVIIRDLIDSEKAHVAELESLVNKFLVRISCSACLTREEYHGLVSNITEIVDVHQQLLKSLVECSAAAPDQQRIGRVFLSSAAKVKQVHQKYCGTHSRAIMILEKYREDLNKIMEGNGASPPGILVLIAGLSKPFRRLEKYHGILQELKRYMEEGHFDRGDVSRSISVYKDLSTACSTIRRQKELELQILNGGVRGWEGDDLSTLGEIIRIGSVALGFELKDRYLVLFPDTLLILSVSNTMTAFVYEGKLPLTGITINKLDHSDEFKNAFEIKGSMIEEIIAICQTKEDQQAWVNDINKQISSARQHSSSSTSSPTSVKTTSTQSSSQSTTNIAPKPPLHAVSSIPYVRLTMYLARLVRKKIITRKVLKRLLYKEYTQRYNTSAIPRRRIHRSEYLILPERASLTWISTSSGSSLTDAAQPPQTEITPAPISDDDSLGSDESSLFDYIAKPFYRTTLTLNHGELKRSPNLVCEDLSKLDDETEMRYQLGRDRAFHNEARQSEPVRTVNVPSLHSVDFKSFSMNCGNFRTSMLPEARCDTSKHKNNAVEKRFCSYYDIASPCASSSEDVGRSNSPAKRATAKVSSGDGCKLKDSFRSSDSGLADLTSPSGNVSARGAMNTESDGSSNFETQCACTSPFDGTPYTSKMYTSEHTADTRPHDELATFKSGMYAHWWLKTKVPASALKAPVSSRFSSDTGKALVNVESFGLCVACTNLSVINT